MERKSDAERLAELKTKQDQLKQKITQLEHQAREKARQEDMRRKLIVGTAVMEHASRHPDFAATLKTVLDAAVTREMDQKAIAGWLNTLFVPAGDPHGYVTDDPASAE